MNSIEMAFLALGVGVPLASAAAQAVWRSEPVLWGREYPVLVHDPQSGDTYAFGGSQNTTQFAEVWRFDGAGWQFAAAMPVGGAISAVFDPPQNRFHVLWDNGLFMSWDRTNWRLEPHLFAGFNPRYQMVRDAQRQVLTVVSTEPAATEVWNFTNGAWTLQPNAGPNPPWNIHGRVSYEPSTGEILSLSAWSPTGMVPLTVWAWNGLAWRQRPTAVQPPALEWFDVGRDPGSGDLLLWGGYRAVNGSAVPNQQMWAYDGTNWRQVGPTGLPPTRFGHALGNDTTQGRLLLFGGRTHANGLHYLADLWAWDGTAWTFVPATPAPTVPGQAPPATARAFDRRTGELLLFPADDQRNALTFDGRRWQTWPCGGSCPADPVYLVADSDLPVPFAIAGNGTFLWTGTSWAQFGAGVTNLPEQAAAAWDGQRVIVFGGLRNQVATNETWAWQAGTWARLNPLHAPPPMAGHQMAAMPGRGILLPTTGRTWWWDGSDWQDRGSMPLPSRTQPAVAWLAERDRVVMHGGGVATLSGYVPTQETWEWDGQAWLRGPDAPLARWQHALVEGPGDRLLIVPGNPESLHAFGSRDPAVVAPFGAGCAGSAGVPTLSTLPHERPHFGTAFSVQLEPAPTGVAALVFGARDDVWNGLPLPQDLGAVGMPGCRALVAPEVTVLGQATGARLAWSVQVPAQASLLGFVASLQGLVLDPSANAAGLTVSNALRARIGRL